MAATRKNKSWGNFLCVAIIMALLLSGCGIIGNRTQKDPTGTFNGKTPVIGLITGEGGIEDSYYKKVWEGLQKAEQDFDLGIGYVKAKNDKDYASKLAELKNNSYEVIVTLGQNPVTAVLEAAKESPKIKYICLDSTIESPVPSNVLSVTYKVEEPSFLAGYIAAKMSKSHVIGFISGDNKDVSLSYYYGYKAGIKYASSGSELMKGIAGTFTNKTRLKEMTERMLKSKADVIFHVAGTAGKGMIEVMTKADKYVIGADTDQNYLAPKNVITSVVKNNDLVIYEMIKAYNEKKLLFGVNKDYGLAENAVSLAETTKDMIPENVYNSVVKVQENIISGKMTIPSTENESLIQK